MIVLKTPLAMREDSGTQLSSSIEHDISNFGTAILIGKIHRSSGLCSKSKGVSLGHLLNLKKRRSWRTFLNKSWGYDMALEKPK